MGFTGQVQVSVTFSRFLGWNNLDPILQQHRDCYHGCFRFVGKFVEHYFDLRQKAEEHLMLEEEEMKEKVRAEDL